jgi:hypothetical protein
MHCLIQFANILLRIFLYSREALYSTVYLGIVFFQHLSCLVFSELPVSMGWCLTPILENSVIIASGNAFVHFSFSLYLVFPCKCYCLSFLCSSWIFCFCFLTVLGFEISLALTESDPREDTTP